MYDGETKANDIAIIKLKYEAILDCNVQTACLPTPDFAIKETVESYAAGWGVFKTENEELPDLLQNVKLDLYPDMTLCKTSGPILPSKQLCAGKILINYY